MKTQKQIKQRIQSLRDKIDEAKISINYKSVPDFTTYRTINTQINTLVWVLDETKRGLGGDEEDIVVIRERNQIKKGENEKGEKH